MEAVYDLVIVGAGLAGMRVAQALRNLGHQGSVLLLGDEMHLPYDRPPLSKQVLAGRWVAEEAALLTWAEADAQGLAVRTGTRVASVQPGSVMLSDGEQIQARRVIVATGVRARVPDEVMVRDRLHVLRTLDDAVRLREAVSAGGSLLVLGGGFIGAEVAATARTLGAEVTLVEAENRLLARALPEEIAEVLTALHERNGVEVRTASPVRKVVQDERRVEALLNDGTALSADHAVIGFGTRIDAAPFTALGDVANGIRCNDAGEVEGYEGLYAVGDVAAWYDRALGCHVRREHWSSATDQAIKVAHTILGVDMPVPVAGALPYFWSDQYNVKIQVLGWPEAADRSQWITYGADEGCVYGMRSAGRLSASSRSARRGCWLPTGHRSSDRRKTNVCPRCPVRKVTRTGHPEVWIRRQLAEGNARSTRLDRRT